MYKLASYDQQGLYQAIVKHKNNKGRYEYKNISNTYLEDLFGDYDGILVRLYDPYRDRDVTLDLSKLQASLVRYKNTLSHYLEEIGNTSIPVSDELFTIKKRHAVYSDAWQAGYRIEAVPATANTDMDLPIEDRSYLSLYKEDLDHRDILKYCLASVNGYIHRLDASKDIAYVIDGMKTILKTGINNIGLTSFKEIGSLSCLSFQRDMIFTRDNEKTLYDGTYIDIGRDTTNYTVFLVLGGYLHPLNGMECRRVADNIIKIVWKNIPLFERYHESMRWIDYTHVPIEDGGYPEFISTDSVMSDEFIKWYLSMSQSFVVLIDNKDVVVDRVNVIRTHIGGQYIALQEPIGPLVLGIGKLGDYWLKYEEGQWLLSVCDNQFHNWTYKTAKSFQYKNKGINDARETQQQTDIAEGYLLDIHTSLQTL